MDGPFALVRDCLRAEEPVVLATVIEIDPREGAEDEILPLAHVANRLKSIRHHTASRGGDVDPDPLSLQVLGRDKGGTATAEGI